MIVKGRKTELGWDCPTRPSVTLPKSAMEIENVIQII
jgi:hypothetical protein